MLRKLLEHPKFLRTPQNIVPVRTSIEQSSLCSVQKYASALKISNQMVKQILYCDFKLHPYKTMLTQSNRLEETKRLLKCYSYSGASQQYYME